MADPTDNLTRLLTEATDSVAHFTEVLTRHINQLQPYHRRIVRLMANEMVDSVDHGQQVELAILIESHDLGPIQIAPFPVPGLGPPFNRLKISSAIFHGRTAAEVRAMNFVQLPAQPPVQPSVPVFWNRPTSTISYGETMEVCQPPTSVPAPDYQFSGHVFTPIPDQQFPQPVFDPIGHVRLPSPVFHDPAQQFRESQDMLRTVEPEAVEAAIEWCLANNFVKTYFEMMLNTESHQEAETMSSEWVSRLMANPELPPLIRMICEKYQSFHNSMNE